MLPILAYVITGTLCLSETRTAEKDMKKKGVERPDGLHILLSSCKQNRCFFEKLGY